MEHEHLTSTIRSELSADQTIFAQADDGLIYAICEGTGDNLDAEDIGNGYVDYIYYDSYKTLEDLKDDEGYDGGMVLLKRPYSELTVREILLEVSDFTGSTFDNILSKGKEAA